VGRVFEQQNCVGLWGVDHWRVAEVQVNAQLTAIAQSPASAHCPGAEHVGAQCLGAGQARDEVLMAQL
jgi:hypothetical protein